MKKTKMRAFLHSVNARKYLYSMLMWKNTKQKRYLKVTSATKR